MPAAPYQLPTSPPDHARLCAMLEAEEGYRGLVYDDATSRPIVPGSAVKGHPTIGVGRALDRKGITFDEAMFLLSNDIEYVSLSLATLRWFPSLDPVRQDCLRAMAFQLGFGGVQHFPAMLEAIGKGDYHTAACGMRASLWAKQTPGRVQRMAAMMETGEYPITVA